MTSVWYLQDCVRIVLPFANFREPTFEAAWEWFQHQALACVACMNIQHLQIRSLVAWCSSIGQQREFKSQKHNSSTLPSQHLQYFDVFSQVPCAWFQFQVAAAVYLAENLEVTAGPVRSWKYQIRIQHRKRQNSKYKLLCEAKVGTRRYKSCKKNCGPYVSTKWLSCFLWSRAQGPSTIRFSD